MPHVAPVLRRRARALPSLLAALALASCSSGSDDQPLARGVELVARSAWCVEHLCRAEAPFVVGQTGITNHPFSVPGKERAMVEVQTSDSAMVGAGLMLWSDGHPMGPATQASLVSFARGIVGECAAVAPYVETQYVVVATSMREVPAVGCGQWQVRAGRLANGFFVSVDDSALVARANAAAVAASSLDSAARLDTTLRATAPRDSTRPGGP